MLVRNHFDDCPYNCGEDGMIVDMDLGKKIPCPHCQKKKKELLADGVAEVESTGDVLPLSTILGIGEEFLSPNFVYASVIPDGERLFIDEESLKWQEEMATELYYNLSIGERPTDNLCFGIGIKGDISKFVYPMLAKAYLSGLSVGKFMTCTEYSMKLFSMDKYLSDLYDVDVLIMLLDEGCNLNGVSSAKSLMQTRATKGKCTIFVTTWTIEACSGLLDFVKGSNRGLAKPVFVKYKSAKSKKQSSYINGLLGVENEKLSVGSDSFSSMDDLLSIK